MKKIIVIIIVIVIAVVSIVYMHFAEVSRNKRIIQEINNEFLNYEKSIVQINTVISLMNKAIQQNIDNNIPQDEKKFFKENDYNSIKVFINIKSRNSTIPMEDLILNENAGMEKVSYAFSDMIFEMTDIEYHKNGQVKKVIFTAIEEELKEKNN